MGHACGKFTDGRQAPVGFHLFFQIPDLGQIPE